MNPLTVYDFLFVFRMQFAQTVGMMILDNSCSISDLFREESARWACLCTVFDGLFYSPTLQYFIC